MIKSLLPKSLIYSRLICGIVILLLSLMHASNYAYWAVILLTLGLLTDIFDGIIARYLNVSTIHLRRLDSAVDQVFFILVALSVFFQCPHFFYDNKIKLIILLGLEGLAYLICFIKFKKEVATHAIASKIWTLILFATLVQIILTCESGMLFQLCLYTGIATRLEIIGIILLLRIWTNDVPSLYHAVLLRKGKPIKRSKLFNG